MSLLNDPDYLSQGNVVAFDSATYPNYGLPGTPIAVTVGAGGAAAPNAVFSNATATTLPAISQYGYFEIRGATSANNNGLYQVERVLTANERWDVRKVAGSQGNLTTHTGDSNTVLLGGDTVLGNTTPGTALSLTATGKSVYYDTYQKEVWLINQGNLNDTLTSPQNGVQWQSLYSFAKEEWKDDPYLIKFDFPFTAITPEQFEIGSGTATGWRFFANTVTTSALFTGIDGNGRKAKELLRTGGWREYLTDGTTVAQEYSGVISLGTFQDDADNAYFQQGDDPTDTAARESFVFAGAVNEAVLTYDYINYPNTSISVTVTDANTLTRSAGSWIDDGYQVGGQLNYVTSSLGNEGVTVTIESLTATVMDVVGAAAFGTTGADANFTAAVDNRNVLNVFLRANTTTSESKSFDAGTLSDIGVTTLTNQVYRFPLTNSLDIDITSGADVTTSPYDVIDIRYFASPFQRRIDDLEAPAVLRDFGIVIDSGTYSGVDGSITSTGTTLTSLGSNIPDVTFDSGRLYIYNGTANTYLDGLGYNSQGYYDIAADGTQGTSVEITGTTFPATESGLSFSIEPSVAPTATLQQIYTKVQYSLRQDADINGDNVVTANVVTGSTADELLAFVGSELFTGDTEATEPTNPNGGGSGVMVQGFLATQQNDLTFRDNAGSEITFPATIAITINFNTNLTDDQDSVTGGVQTGNYWLFYEYVKRRTVTDVGSISGFSATITGTGNLARDSGKELIQLQVDDYIKTSGFADDGNNGVWRITDVAGLPNSLVAVKVDGRTPVATTGESANLDEDPIDTPDAIIVDDDGGTDVLGTIPTNGIKQFNYNYDTNAQGGKIGGSDVPVIVRAIGLEKGQFVESSSTALGDGSSDVTIAVTSGLERNYSNS